MHLVAGCPGKGSAPVLRAHAGKAPRVVWLLQPDGQEGSRGAGWEPMQQHDLAAGRASLSSAAF